MNTVTSGDQIKLLTGLEICKRTLNKIKITGKPCTLSIFAGLLDGRLVDVQADELRFRKCAGHREYCVSGTTAKVKHPPSDG